jgi:tetratricopeptide (TPR) repeat protein
LGKRIARSGRHPGLVVLLFCSLFCCASLWGRSAAPEIPPGPAGAAETESEDVTAAERPELALKPWEEIQYRNARPLYTRPAGLLLFLPGPLFFLAVLFLPASVRRKWPVLLLILLLGAGSGVRDPDNGTREAEAAFARGDLREAAALLQSALETEYADNPALMYNLAVCRHLLGQHDQAIYLLRKSLKAAPGDRMLREALLTLEREYGLSGQLALPPPLTAGLPFVLAALFSNLAFVAGALFLRRRRVQVLILLVLLVTAALVSLGFYLNLRSRVQQSVGVVTAGAAELKMIPRIHAHSRLRLAEGTSLYVLGEDEQFVLVETGFGFKGWIEKQSLLID